jgi:hypothetical protein
LTIRTVGHSLAPLGWLGVSMGRRILLRCAIFVGTAASGFAVAAQEVGPFYKGGKPEYPVYANEQDKQTAIAMARGFGGYIDDDGVPLSCVWRSPLKSPGGYADGGLVPRETGKGVGVYTRIPFARSAVTLKNLRFVQGTAFSSDPYLEIFADIDPVTGKVAVADAGVVLPPIEVPGSRAPPRLRAVRGDLAGRHMVFASFNAGPPGLPSRIDFDEDMRKALDAWAQGGAFTLEAASLVPNSDPSAQRISIATTFSRLPEDIVDWKRFNAKQVAIREAKACKVREADCVAYGKCGL